MFILIPHLLTNHHGQNRQHQMFVPSSEHFTDHQSQSEESMSQPSHIDTRPGNSDYQSQTCRAIYTTADTRCSPPAKPGTVDQPAQNHVNEHQLRVHHKAYRQMFLMPMLPTKLINLETVSIVTKFCYGQRITMPERFHDFQT